MNIYVSIIVTNTNCNNDINAYYITVKLIFNLKKVGTVKVQKSKDKREMFLV